MRFIGTFGLAGLRLCVHCLDLEYGYPIVESEPRTTIGMEEAGMKIVARIEKLAGVQFRFDGKTFDTFMEARRAMTRRAKLRRIERDARASRRGLAMQVTSSSR